jgi:hypothetical protein
VEINALLSGCAWNLKKMMERLKENLSPLILRIFFPKKYFMRRREMGLVRSDYLDVFSYQSPISL